MRVAFVSTHLPRRCGLATFNHDLMRAMKAYDPYMQFKVACIDEPGVTHEVDNEVQWRIQQDDPDSFARAALAINASGVDAVIIQHEFGLFGTWTNTPNGDVYNNYLEPFFKNIRVPVITTFHTVQRQTTPSMRAAIRYISSRSARVIVMAQTAVDLLDSVYNIEKAPLLIPHGVPPIDPRGRAQFKQKLGLGDKTIISTFGLVDPRKGLEYMIEALPSIVERHPDTMYLIVGQTHPAVVAKLGEGYRESLVDLAAKNGMSNNIAFVNRYLGEKEIIDYLVASDVYVTPYLDPNQITSGTLSFALGAGRAIISTAYLHAQEALADGRGRLVDFRSASQLADETNAILGDPMLKQRLEQNSYEYGKELAWPKIAQRVINELNRVVTKKVSQRNLLLSEKEAVNS